MPIVEGNFWSYSPPATVYFDSLRKPPLEFFLCKFPPVCNASDKLICEPHEKAEITPSRFASSSTLLSYPTPPIPTFPIITSLQRTFGPGKSDKRCVLWTCTKHSVRTALHPFSLKYVFRRRILSYAVFPVLLSIFLYFQSLGSMAKVS